MGKGPACCPHCGRMDWGRAPGIWQALVWATQQTRGWTVRQLADALGLQIANAHNRAQVLVAMGHVAKLTTITHPSGGIQGVYQATPQGLQEVARSAQEAAGAPA